MKTVFSLLFVLSFLAASAQKEIDTASGPNLDTRALEESLSRKKVRFNVEFGTTFVGGSYGSYFGSYVAPHVAYPLGKRFELRAGASISAMSPMAHGGEAVMFGYPYGNYYSRSFVYVSGAYRLTDNLTVTGTAYREINPFGRMPQASGMAPPEARGLIMGVDYRIGDHIFIRGEVEVREGYRPFHYDPFMNPARRGMNDPFFFGP